MAKAKPMKKPKKKSTRKPKVVLQKVIGENEWIVWIGSRWGGVIKKRRGVWLLGSRRRFATRKAAVEWLLER